MSSVFDVFPPFKVIRNPEILACGIQNPVYLESEIQPLESRMQESRNPACCTVVPGPLSFWKVTIAVKNSSCGKEQEALPRVSVDTEYQLLKAWYLFHGVKQWRDRLISWSCDAWNKGTNGYSRSLDLTQTPLRLQSNWNQVLDFCNYNNSKNFIKWFSTCFLIGQQACFHSVLLLIDFSMQYSWSISTVQQMSL